MYTPPSDLLASIEQPDNEVGNLSMQAGKDPVHVSKKIQTPANTRSSQLPLNSKIALAKEISKPANPMARVVEVGTADAMQQAKANQQPFTEQNALKAEFDAINDARKSLPMVDEMGTTSPVVALSALDGASKALETLKKGIKSGDIQSPPLNDSMDFVGLSGTTQAEKGMEDLIKDFSKSMNSQEWERAGKIANSLGIDGKDIRVLDVGYEDFMTQKEIDLHHTQAQTEGIFIRGEPVSQEYVASLVEEVKSRESFRFLPDAVWQELRGSPELYSAVSKESGVREIGLEDRTGKREYHEYLIDHFVGPIVNMAGSALEGAKELFELGKLNDKPTVNDDPIRHNTYKYLDKTYAERSNQRNIIKHVFDQTINGSHESVDQLYRHLRDNFDKLPVSIWAELNSPRVRNIMELGIDEGQYRKEGKFSDASKSLKRFGTKDSKAESVDSVYEYTKIGAGAIGSAVGFLLPTPVFSFGGKALAYTAAIAKSPVLATKVRKLHKVAKMAPKGSKEHAALTLMLNAKATKLFPSHANIAKVSHLSGTLGIGAAGVAVHRTEASDRANQSFASAEQKGHHMDVSYLIGMSEIVPLGRFAPDASWIMGRKLSITTKDGAVIRGAADVSRSRVFSGVIDRTKSATRSAIEETMQEASTTLFHNMLEGEYNRDVTKMDDLMEAAIGGSIAGGFLGFIMPGKGIRRMSFDKTQIAKQSKGIQEKADEIEKFVNSALDTVGSIENMGSTEKNMEHIVEAVAQIMDGFPETAMTRRLSQAIVETISNGKALEDKETLKGFFEAVVALGVIFKSTEVTSTRELVEALGSVKHIMTPDAETRNFDPELLEAALKVNPSGMVKGLFHILDQLTQSDSLKGMDTDNIHNAPKAQTNIFGGEEFVGTEQVQEPTPEEQAEQDLNLQDGQQDLFSGDFSGGPGTNTKGEGPLGGRIATSNNSFDPMSEKSRSSNSVNSASSGNKTDAPSQDDLDAENENAGKDPLEIEYTDENGNKVKLSENSPPKEQNEADTSTQEEAKKVQAVEGDSPTAGKTAEGDKKKGETQKASDVDIEKENKIVGIKSILKQIKALVANALGGKVSEGYQSTLNHYEGSFKFRAKGIINNFATLAYKELADIVHSLAEGQKLRVMQLLHSLYAQNRSIAFVASGNARSRVLTYLAAVRRTLDSNPKAVVLIVAEKGQEGNYTTTYAQELEAWGLHYPEYADRIKIVSYEYLATLGRNVEEHISNDQRQETLDNLKDIEDSPIALVIYDGANHIKDSKDSSTSDVVDALNKEKGREKLSQHKQEPKTIYAGGVSELSSREVANIILIAGEAIQSPSAESIGNLRTALTNATGMDMSKVDTDTLGSVVLEIASGGGVEYLHRIPAKKPINKLREEQDLQNKAKETLSKLFNSTFWLKLENFKGVNSLEKLQTALNIQVSTLQELQEKGFDVGDKDVYVIDGTSQGAVSKAYIVSDNLTPDTAADVLLPLMSRRVLAFVLGFTAHKGVKGQSTAKSISAALRKPPTLKELEQGFGDPATYVEFLKALDALASVIHEALPISKKTDTGVSAVELDKAGNAQGIADKHMTLMRWMFGATVKENTQGLTLDSLLQGSSISSVALTLALEHHHKGKGTPSESPALDRAVAKIANFLDKAKASGMKIPRAVPKDKGKALVSEPSSSIGQVGSVEHKRNENGSSYVFLNWGAVGLRIHFPSATDPYKKKLSISPTKNKKTNKSLQEMASKDKALNAFRKGLEGMNISAKDLAEGLEAYQRSDNFYSSASNFLTDWGELSSRYSAKDIQSVHRLSVPNSNSSEVDGSTITGAKTFIKYYKMQNSVVVAPKGELSNFNLVNALSAAMHISEVEGQTIIEFPTTSGVVTETTKIKGDGVAMATNKDTDTVMLEIHDDIQEDTSKYKCDISKRMGVNG